MSAPKLKFSILEHKASLEALERKRAKLSRLIILQDILQAANDIPGRIGGRRGQSNLARTPRNQRITKDEASRLASELGIELSRISSPLRRLADIKQQIKSLESKIAEDEKEYADVSYRWQQTNRNFKIFLEKIRGTPCDNADVAEMAYAHSLVD